MTDTNDHGKAAAASARAWDEMMADYESDECARLRKSWSARRDAQYEANVGVYAPLARNPWRIRYAIGIAALVVLYGVFEWVVV